MRNRPLLLSLVLIPVAVLLFVLLEPGETSPLSALAILASGLTGLIALGIGLYRSFFHKRQTRSY
ncbi:MAG TPA: hypothetical protein PLZ45_12800 [Ferruginibacter sp.]|nr:hypothetical protein [Ferruginibacter sp.]